MIHVLHTVLNCKGTIALDKQRLNSLSKRGKFTLKNSWTKNIICFAHFWTKKQQRETCNFATATLLFRLLSCYPATHFLKRRFSIVFKQISPKYFESFFQKQNVFTTKTFKRPGIFINRHFEGSKCHQWLALVDECHSVKLSSSLKHLPVGPKFVALFVKKASFITKRHKTINTKIGRLK